jgi:hypothetical protein
MSDHAASATMQLRLPALRYFRPVINSKKAHSRSDLVAIGNTALNYTFEQLVRRLVANVHIIAFSAFPPGF